MKKTVEDIKAMKKKEKIAVLTCYDYSFAKAMDGDVEVILVGDSLGNVVLGYERTKHVTMEDMIRHLDAVKRGAKETFIVVDMPFGSYDNKKDAVENARKLINAGADAVKPEGRAEIVKVLADNGIKVMGHIGLLPQSAKKLGMVGKEKKEAESIIEEAKKIEEAGAFSLVIESIPSSLGEEITNTLEIPTIGIGAGNRCDGQVLVSYDMLGLFPDFKPKFARQYMNLKEDIKKAISLYSKDVKEGKFPSKEEIPL
ncbi:MAG: 3-methyl-2-oxobutanoate hydroxymethyltransferase [Nanoarchaeota archaeon]|nr:3-methyl-2-oxobutanoate hydroxymethyltransferase [Nanoarchaeota archaeon]